MQRLGKNQGRYHGETIDIDQVQEDVHRLALERGWTADTFLSEKGITLRAYHRVVPGPAHNLYISAGIHGDEPSGPLALLNLIRDDAWPEGINLSVVPCLNPTGFRKNTRENHEGIDLNRDYRHLQSREVSAHVRWLDQQPRFDLTLILHEDWEADGFYVYELNPRDEPSLAADIVEGVRELCPIESSGRVDDWTCCGGIIRPDVPPLERPQWAEAIYLILNKTFRSYTVETPSDYPLDLRVRAHVHAVRKAVAGLLAI